MMLIGRDESELIGQHFEAFVAEDQFGKELPRGKRALHRALKLGESISIGEEYYYVVDERRIPVWVTASPIKVGDEVTGAISVSRNISHEKELDRMKSELIYLASHQLRTPASAVKSSLSLLLDGYLGRLSVKQMNDLRTAYAENDFELKLIDDILNVAKLDSKKTEIMPEKFDLGDVVRRVADEESKAVSDHKQHLTVKTPKKLAMFADSTKVREVIENLVSNAVKYTPDGGHIHLSATSKGQDVVITVSDDGIGIPEKDLPNIFGKFVRASNATTKSMPGTGLGLYLAKNIIEMHGGSITIESELGKGTTFTVMIPKKYKEISR